MEVKMNKKKAVSETRELMRIGIATDFGWFELKAKLTAALYAAGYEIADMGAYELVTEEDYPDFIVPLVKAPYVNKKKSNLTISESGVEACAAANKIPGVYAVLITESFTPYKENEDLYVRCLGGQITGYALSDKKVMNFLNAGYTAGIPSNHRLAKVKALKKQVLTFILLIVACAAFAQSPISKGQSQINVGVGFSSWGVPVYLGFDHGVHPDITLGAEASFRSFNDNWLSHKYRHSVIGIQGNANYHFNRILNIPSNWDFYAGVNLGFYSWNSPHDYEGSHTSGVGIGAQIGGRYYFSKNVGVNLEFGGGNAFSGGKFGLTIKI